MRLCDDYDLCGYVIFFMILDGVFYFLVVGLMEGNSEWLFFFVGV